MKSTSITVRLDAKLAGELTQLSRELGLSRSAFVLDALRRYLAQRKTMAERHAQLDRAGLIHRVEGKPGQASFPLGVRKPGALQRFLNERD